MSSESSSQSRSPTISNDDARKLAVQDPALYNAGLDAVRGVTPEQLRIRFKEDRPWRHEMLGDGQFKTSELTVTEHLVLPRTILFETGTQRFRRDAAHRFEAGVVERRILHRELARVVVRDRRGA